jgi:glyoxylase-like metal-dependent hydrolase (beta-lactamase superfamily II)
MDHMSLRKDFSRHLAAMLLCATMPPTLASAQSAAAPEDMLARFRAMDNAVLTVKPLNGGVYWVSGGVANSGFVVGDKGVIVVDAQMTVTMARKLLAEIAKVTPKPVNAILLTHADPDHVGGIPAYPADAAIIAQENTKSIIVASIADTTGGPMWGPMYKALADHLPTKTIGVTENVSLDGVPVVLIHGASAHTSADLAVYLPKQKIVFGGDIILTRAGLRFPVIHSGGSSLGWIEFMKTLLALDAQTYIPGHGPIETRQMLQARLADAEKRRADVKSMAEKNKGLAEVEQALPDTAADPMFPTFTRIVYEELTKGYPPAVAPWAMLKK